MSVLIESTSAFPNALMLFETEDHPEVPDIDGIANIRPTESILAVAVQHESEGDVELRVTTEEPHASAQVLHFEGILATKRRLVEIRTVYLDRVTGIRTLSTEQPIRIWGDDARQPEYVVVRCLGVVGGLMDRPRYRDPAGRDGIGGSDHKVSTKHWADRQFQLHPDTGSALGCWNGGNIGCERASYTPADLR